MSGKVKVRTAVATLRIREAQIEAITTRLRSAYDRMKEFNAADGDAFLMRQKLVALKELYDDHQAKLDDILEVLPTESFEERMQAVETFDLVYQDTCALVDRQLQAYLKAEQPQVQQQPQQQQIVITEAAAQIQLPAIPLPVFDGQYNNWINFSEKFTALIGNHATLTDVQKLHYLRGALVGDAKSVEAGNDSYQSLWAALKQRFELKRVIAERHINEIFAMKPIQQESAAQLRHLVNLMVKNIRVLNTIELPLNALSEMIFVNVVCSKLDPDTRKAFEMKLSPDAFSKWDTLLKFLEARCHLLESIEGTRQPNYRGSRPPQRPTTRVQAMVSQPNPGPKCPHCSETHYISQCASFLNLNPKERADKVKQMKLCTNCLSHRHSIEKCRSSSCRKCQKRHHSLLHSDEPAAAEGGTGPTVQAFMATPVAHSGQVILATAAIYINDATGTPIPCRALLDSGSESNFVTKNLAQLLGLHRQPIRTPLLGIGHQMSTVKYKIETKIMSRTSEYSAKLEFLILPRISGDLPSSLIDRRALQIPADITLADPGLHIPRPIDILLGAEVFYEVLTHRNMTIGPGLPSLTETQFGWIIGGRFQRANPSSTSFCGIATISTDDQLIDQVKQFWAVENCELKKPLTPEEKLVENHFAETVKRQADGRYIVSLPTKPNVNQLGNSHTMALKRFGFLERRLLRDDNLRKQYTAFIDEYLKLDHMRPASTDQQANISYFLPHHAVIKPESSTTKLRVVFDGSAATSSGLSLNEVLRVGPTVQQELFDIITRFRKHRVAFTADICKMYRQVKVDDDQTSLQQILWRSSASEDIKAYRLTTVTYGTACAPYLATRVLQQLAMDEQTTFPAAADVTRRDFYVDDVLSGAETVQEAMEIQNQLVSMLKRGGFELHKWCSNSTELLEKIPIDKREPKAQLSDSPSVKTLGLSWHPSSDMLAITTERPLPQVQITKRSVLSDIAKLFDPLGLTGPIIVTAKLFLQKLWQRSLGWDEELSELDANEWSNYRTQLNELHQIEVPRCVLPVAQPKSIKLLGFCDASLAAYGACIYVHCVDSSDNRHTTLLCSKSRVAPLKAITVPRLELCSALLLAQLMTKVRTAMEMRFDQTILWSDSTIVLSWIRSQSIKMKTYVAHRVAEIHELTQQDEWRHIQTLENPADVISRGLMPSELENSRIWWSGPSFIEQPEAEWPSSLITIAGDQLPEMKPITALIAHKIQPFHDFTKFSSLEKIKRIMAYALRFIHNCRHKNDQRRQLLTVMELTDALYCIVRMVQQEEFGPEYRSAKLGKQIDSDSPLRFLNIFLDDKNLIRVGGRLRNSNLPFDTKHQIVLPKRHYITTLLVRTLHQHNGHVGQQGLMAIVRQSYWPVGARDVIRAVTKNCVKCFKYRPKVASQFQGDLPAHRTSVCHPFLNAGVDYAGPLTLKLTRRTSCKAYIAIFVCMATKAIHIELVSDLTSSAFIAALSRFTSRRGNCQNLYSDNATNFVGAKNELANLYRLLEDEKTQRDVHNALAPQNIQFHFIPPRAPHFGGLWEAAVKSTKYHLRRIVGTTPLTFEEMSTVLTRIEAILNSRPLVPESNDPEDVNALTPGHFIIGRPLVALAEPDFADVAVNRIRRWQLLQKLSQQFWKRWSTDYLTTLQQRPKVAPITEISADMLVLVKEDNLPPMQWCLGRIIALHPGLDGIVRVVTIKTKSGLIKRPVAKICILPGQQRVDQ